MVCSLAFAEFIRVCVVANSPQTVDHSAIRRIRALCFKASRAALLSLTEPEPFFILIP